MGLQGYVGNTADAARIRRLEREREEDKQRVEDLKKEAASKPAGFRQWHQGSAEVLESAFKKETVGLVTKDEYVTKKATIQARLEADALKRKRCEEELAEAARSSKQAQLAKQRRAAKLSFAVGDDGEDEGDVAEASAPQRLRLRKDDTVQTDFLPDVERERQKEELKARLKQEWREQQEALKRRDMHVNYSYWDGSGHRRHATIKVGDKIADLLKIARDQLSADFAEMRHVSVENLMFVKDDIILPQTTTFYELIAGKARGPLGPLFSAEAVENSKVEDRELEGRHAAKVVERHWYERSKHIFPANRWVLYDADVHAKK